MTTAPDLVGRSEAFARLVVAQDGDEYVLGRPDLGVFVVVPPPGAVLIVALQGGSSIADASRKASEAAGEPVDGEEFLAALSDAGLLDLPAAEGSNGLSAAGRGVIRWIEGVSPRAAARLFGTPAWLVYGAAALCAIVVLITHSDLRPSFESFYFVADPVLSMLLYLPIAILLGAAHEAWHWLAGRALGIPAIFRISYRGLFVVFETDLTQIVTIPRRRRYGVFFAGMAFDCVVLAVALLLRLFDAAGLLALPGWLGRLLGAVVLGQVFAIVWQWAAVFLRSDVYAALANLLGCHNLYRVTWLTLKDRLWPLDKAESNELVQAGDRDRRVARWFSLVYLAGLLTMGWMFLVFVVPSLVAIGAWLVANFLTHKLTTMAFWEALVVSVYLIANYAGPPLLALRERRLRARGAIL